NVLLAAAIYNLAWGAWVVLRPNDLFDIAGIQPPRYPGIWQCVGMIVGVYGIGYWLASRDPFRHWPITLVGLIGKVLGPIGFFGSILFARSGDGGQLPLSWGWTIVTNDLIWWGPFASILYLTFKRFNEPLPTESLSVERANQEFRSQHGASIQDLSASQDVLLLFLRHSGCTFCRESLKRLSEQRTELTKADIIPVLVHMGTNNLATEAIQMNGLENEHRINDPRCQLYQAYSLRRGNLAALFGWNVWYKGFIAAILKRHGVGKLGGDGFQLGGSFLVRDNAIVRAWPQRTAADHVDACELTG
ncbi:MAG: hypothetical protein AAF989_04095, partial [Planctomycetota bacterium]